LGGYAKGLHARAQHRKSNGGICENRELHCSAGGWKSAAFGSYRGGVAVNRRPFEVALSVFAFSVATELLCIRMLRGSLIDWLNQPHRELLLLSMILVNLLNAVTAMYFSSRAVRAEVNLKLRERKQEEIGIYLNHHLRNALSVVQNAAFLTNDEQTIKLCDDAVKRIVQVLVSTEAGLTDPSAVLFVTVPGRRSNIKGGNA
jgi:hypothetical protein